MDSNSSYSSSKEESSTLLTPLAKETISAGFPSPAEDYIELGIDLNKYLIKNPISTFFLRVSGSSMNNAGIYNNDLLIIDRSINPKPGHIVVALLDEEFTLKRLIKEKDNYYLKAEKENLIIQDLIDNAESYLCEIKNTQIRTGLHVFGVNQSIDK